MAHREQGFSAIYLSVIVAFLTLSLGLNVFVLSANSQRLGANNSRSLQALYAAESGIEDAAYRVKNLLPYAPSYVLAVGSSQATVGVASLGAQKEVTSQGQLQNRVRKAKAVLSVSQSAISFVYGVQVGSFGLTLGNGSQVIGSVFSNGSITGSGKNQSTITGTAQAAGNSDIRDIRVNGDAYADAIGGCIVGGTAHYFNTIEDCTAGSTQVLPQQVQPQNFPITQAQIDAWKAEALAGGTQGTTSFGNEEQVSLGPKKIAGSLSAGNTVTLTLGGTVWVTGAMSTGNNTIIQLSSGYGSSSGVLLVDGPVSFGNGAVLRGSGTGQSKLMVVSLSTGTAFSLGNTGSGDIFYAPNGTISIGNTFAAEELTGKGLAAGNNTTITYESGLASASFSEGPGGTFNVVSWQEIE